MPQHQHRELAILGAGLTGLSAALASRERGIRYELFEREQLAGGLARTTLDSGYRFDCTGHLLHIRDAALKRQVLNWLGADHRIIKRESRVWSHGVYTDYPFQANAHGLPPKVVYECVIGFVQAQAQVGATPRNFEEYCRTHFGDGISEHFMLPYNTRLWGVTPDQITAEWCQRFVPLPSLKEVIAGAVGLPTRRLGYNAEFIYPLRGIGSLVQVMERQLGQIRFGMAPLSIDCERRHLRFDDAVVEYENLISSIPLVKLLQLCERLPEEVNHAANQLHCTHLYYLDIALRTACQQSWHWAYVPEAKYPFYRVGCYSNFSELMAPPGCANLYVELVERTLPRLDTILPKVIEGLLEMNVITSGADVSFARLRRIDHAYVIFDHDYYSATAKVRAFLREHAIISTGRYGEWTYSSMEDALLSGRQAVKELYA